MGGFYFICCMFILYFFLGWQPEHILVSFIIIAIVWCFTGRDLAGGIIYFIRINTFLPARYLLYKAFDCSISTTGVLQ